MKKNIFIIFILLLTSSLFSKTIMLKIIDKDLDIPLEGVKVETNITKNIFFSNPKGRVNINIDNEEIRIIINCHMLGYESKKIKITDFDDKEIIIKMAIDSVIEGEELVIEENYYKKQDKVGTSILVDKEELKNLAMRGTIEDVVSSIKTLPGVSYSSSFYTSLSVRGGDTDELAASMDGFIIRYPFYWGGSSSIFNPNIVESAVFNNGVFSAKYGMALSGFLEVNTKVPNEIFKFYTNLAMSTVEGYLEIPLGLKNSGLLLQARATYLETSMGLAWAMTPGIEVPRVPYIYDGNFKWYWKPTDRIEWYINGFVGADGIGMVSTEEDTSSGVDTTSSVNDHNIHAIGFTGMKILASDKIFVHWLAGYEYYSAIYEGDQEEKGIKNNVPVSIETSYEGITNIHTFQTRIDTDFELHKKILLNLGAGLIYDFKKESYEVDYFDIQNNLLVNDPVDFGDSNHFYPSTFFNFNFKPVTDKLEIDLGCRLDHYFGIMDENSLNTYPVANPRFYIAYTPVRNLKFLEYITLSLGSGLYSDIPDYRYNKEDPLENLSIKQQKSLNTILGLEIMLAHGFKIKLETYYKYYFDQYYMNAVVDANGNKEYIQHSDGIGHAAGFDLILKRRISRYIDGWISYSFIFARYYNPQSDDQYAAEDGEPNGQWYYPSYHRWHSINIVLNIKPTPWLTISPSLGIHTGLPKTVFGEAEPKIYLSGATPLTVYSRQQYYSDTERTGVSLPFSLKVAFHKYFPKSRLKIEIYAAFDNIFAAFANIDEAAQAFWYPDRKEVVDKYTGDIVKNSPQAYETFLPSFGIKLSY